MFQRIIHKIKCYFNKHEYGAYYPIEYGRTAVCKHCGHVNVIMTLIGLTKALRAHDLTGEITAMLNENNPILEGVEFKEKANDN